MQPLSEQMRGTLYQRGETTALLLDETAALCTLRFALLVQGTEQVVFPALVLDDWGRERNSLALYRWIYEEGQRFPRAEVFGFDRSGQETQIFLRDLEIFFNYPCFAYPERKTPLSEGERLTVVFIPGEEGQESPEKAKVPAALSWPLQHAAVSWRRASRETLAAAGWQPLADW